MNIQYDKPIELKQDKTLGYMYFIDKEHPLASGWGKVWYHRHIASIKAGHWLSSQEHVHHTDGNKQNNDSDNLNIVTPSSHAKLHHHAIIRKCEVCGKDTKNVHYCSRACMLIGRRKVVWPTKEALSKDIQSMSFLAIGRKYGVSDNAIRKWAKKYKIMPV